MSITGRVFDIRRFSIHDGPGIRTTVFLKGCPLRCVWCHNPEGGAIRPEVWFDARRCIACGECVRACPNGLHRLDRATLAHVYDRSRCVVCGACVRVCETDALRLAGREMTVEAVMSEVLEDRVFYKLSGGGLTISGGEPLTQLEFTAALLEVGRRSGMHLCLETCGAASWERFERVLPLTDLFLYDIKETDPARHAEFTGVSNEIILSNLRALYRHGARIQLQCLIVPGYNDRQDHLDTIVAMAREMPAIAGVRLLRYHAFGDGKLSCLGHERPPLGVRPIDSTSWKRWITRLVAQGVNVLNEDTE